MRARPAFLFALLASSLLGATCKGNGNDSHGVEPGPSQAPAAPAAPEKPEPLVKAPEVTDIEGVDVAELPTDVRSDFWRILNETFCYCACPRTLAACLANRQDCSCVECSERMTRFVIDQFKGGASTEEVELQLVEGFSEGYNGAARDLPLADQPTKGPENAKYTLVEFADFRCAHCKAAAPVLKKLVETHPEIRLVYFYFPLGQGNDTPSVLAAEAAEEARVQGKFWEMSELLFKNQIALEHDDLIKYAAQLGLDVERFKTALDRHTHRDRVLEDKSIGMRVNVQATPTIFVNGRPFGLDRTLENFNLRLQMEEERGHCK